MADPTQSLSQPNLEPSNPLPDNSLDSITEIESLEPSNPLADNSLDSIIENLEPSNPLPDNSLDSIIENFIGDNFNWALFLQAAVVSFAWFFDAQQVYISIFADAEPAWHCQTQLNTCSSVSDICKLPRDSWAWSLPAKASTISAFGLHCSKSLVKGMPASAFFVGSFMGGLTLATLADSLFGRKKTLFLSCMCMSVFALLTAFSTNVWMYSALRFASGVGRSVIGTCALVLPAELVGKRWRGQVGVLGFAFYTLGFLSLPAMAYPNRGNSWSNLFIWTSVPIIIYCLAILLLVSESPRWLFVKGRKEEAIETLKSMASRHDIQSSNITEIFSNMPLDQQETPSPNLYSAIKILVNKKWALRRLLAAMALGFGVATVYYGMPLALGNLDVNLYVSVTFNALSDFPSALVVSFLVAKANRKTSILISTILSGIFSIMSAFKVHHVLWTRLRIGFELLSFFSACTAADLVLLFAVELFPTSVRNSAVSMVRQAFVLGGVVAPLLAAAGRGDRGIVSYGVFGVAIGLSGLFVLCLPETRGTALCDTMEDEERKLEAAKCHNTITSTNVAV